MSCIDNKLVETNAVYSFVMPFFDYELEAKWDFFTIEYELDGGLNNSLNPTNYTIESTNLNLYAPTRQGYDFAGWEYKGSIVSSVNPNWASNIVLTAMWRASRNLLTVNSKDSSKGTVSIVSGSGYSGESIIVEATPAGGYVFNGWYQGTSLVSKQTRYTFTMPTSDYSLSARFLTQAEEVKERNKALGITPVIDAVNNTVTYGLYPQKNINDSTATHDVTITKIDAKVFKFNPSTYADGTFSYTIDVKDKAGNQADRIVIKVQRDITGPTVTIKNPAANITSYTNALDDESYTFRINATDGAGVGVAKLSYAFSTNSSAPAAAEWKEIDFSDGDYNIDIPLKAGKTPDRATSNGVVTKLCEGVWYLYAKAADKSGNKSATTQKRQIRIDKSAPALALTDTSASLV